MRIHAIATTVLAAGLFAMSFAGTAYARDQVFTAKLATPAAQSEVIAQSTLWTCEGDTCRAVANHAPTVRACRQLVREVGPVSAYGPAGDELDAEELARCNGVVANRETQHAGN